MPFSVRRTPAPLFVAFTCAATLIAAGNARASFVVNFYEGSTLVESLSSANGGPISFAGSVGDFSVNLKYQLLTAAGGLQAIVTSGQATVTNNDTRNAHSLTIYAVDRGTIASGPPGGPGQGVLSGILTSHVGNADSLLAKSITGNSATPPRLLAGSGLIGSDYDVKFGRGGTFSVVSLESFRLMPGATVTFSQEDPGFSAVNMPAPAGITLALAGLPCVACYWLCKRRHMSGLSRAAAVR